METRVLPANLEQWDTVCELCEKLLDCLDCSEKVKNEILISVEEVFTNITSYSYEDENGRVEVSCGTNEEEEKEFWISFKDWGTPYNPLKRPDPDFGIPFEDRGIGGLGIYMVKKFMDRVEYQHDGSCNIFTIGKKL